jgi:hypothetical protein
MKSVFAAMVVLGICASARLQANISVAPSEVTGPNNTFRDSVMGISLTYPAGWEMLGGARWGPDNRENTFRFRPLWPSEAGPSLYYQGFRPDSPRPTDVSAWLREAARKKEESRKAGMSDYRNEPETLAIRTIAGRPGMSYVATFTSGGRKIAEYNLRIVGDKAYVMFFTMGPLEDVLALRSEIDKMAETVQVP